MEELFDLLTTVEYGGCSAKIPPGLLKEALKGLPLSTDPDLLVDVNTQDDAGVYRISEDTALIFTTDFFPPVCSDPFTFGEIAAANALSDVYAMGGEPLMALNLVMFSGDQVPVTVFDAILKGGQSKVTESGALIVGGHTLDDHPPKYGLAVIGRVHPAELITNAGAQPGDRLVLTKPIGTGAVVTGARNELVSEKELLHSLNLMKQLNRVGARVARRYRVGGMTDITGFGLAGHALEMTRASQVSFRINTSAVPLVQGAYHVYEKGSIPGAAFRNLEFTGNNAHYVRGVDYNRKMLMHDPQTSGGLLMSVNPDHVPALLEQIRKEDPGSKAEIVGEVLERSPRQVYFE